MRETIRYWLLTLWQTVQVALWAVLFIGVIFLARVDFSQGGISSYLLPAVITTSAALSQMLCGPGMHILYMPVQLALGETRRNILVGYLAGLVLYALAPAVLCALLLALSPAVPNRLALALGLLLVQLLSGAASNLLGVIYARWKLIGCFIIGAVSACIGGGFVSIGMLDLFSDRLSLAFLGRGSVLAGMAVAVAALLALGGLLTALRLRRLEVKL